MLDNLAVLVEAKNVDARPGMIARPFLSAVQDNVVALRNHALELDGFTGIATGRFLEIGYEPILAVSNTRIVLDARYRSMASRGRL